MPSAFRLPGIAPSARHSPEGKAVTRLSYPACPERTRGEPCLEGSPEDTLEPPMPQKEQEEL
ncbi:MAG: hypothetical protein P8017_07820 [Deltaproteobacteria bacterium]